MNFLGRISTWLDGEDEPDGEGSYEGSAIAHRGAGRGDDEKGAPVHPDDWTAEGLMPLTQEALQELMDQASHAKPWDPETFQIVRVLQEASRNHGNCNLVRSLAHEEAMVAMKKMPTRWVTLGPREFNKAYPTASEQPWVDIGIVTYLYRQGCPYVCKPLGVFRDGEHTYVGSSLATEGDLFAWCSSLKTPSKATEDFVRPIAGQIVSAVRGIHDLGIAHRDLSLENILLTASEDGLRVRVIDYGMATLSRSCRCEARGKKCYQAPEMHFEAPYDPFLTDAFALGIVLFGMIAQDYPWVCTQNGKCRLYDYIREHGLRGFLARRKVRRGGGQTLSMVLSDPLICLLEGLLQIRPGNRLTLGEACWADERRSIWDLDWLQGWKLSAQRGREQPSPPAVESPEPP